MWSCGHVAMWSCGGGVVMWSCGHVCRANGLVLSCVSESGIRRHVLVSIFRLVRKIVVHFNKCKKRNAKCMIGISAIYFSSLLLCSDVSFSVCCMLQR